MNLVTVAKSAWWHRVKGSCWCHADTRASARVVGTQWLGLGIGLGLGLGLVATVARLLCRVPCKHQRLII